MSTFSIDFIKAAELLGIHLPPRIVIYGVIVLVVLFPLLAIMQAMRLRNYGDSNTLFWFAIAYSVAVLAVLVYLVYRAQKLLNRFHLRVDGENEVKITTI
jgi:uncharacterized membrane protein YhaH (DUF805 family)